MGKNFSLGAVLTVTTGKFLVEDIGDLYGILEFMTGETLWTHQLLRASEAAKVYLWRQYPELIDITAPEFEDADHAWSWLHEQEEKYGKTFEITQMPDGAYPAMDPVDELVSMRESVDGVLVVNI